MNFTLLAVVILLLFLAATAGFLLRGGSSGRRKRRSEDVPPAMRPAYSDEQLERNVLERYMGWGLVFTVFFALFLPVYWIYDTQRLGEASPAEFVVSVESGEELYQANCAQCHGTNLGGGAAPSPYGNEPWPAPQLDNIATRYAESQNVQDLEDFIETTLHRGRPGTPMPTWGAEYGGPMTDEMITDITDYILANQVEEPPAQPVATAGQTGEQLYQGNCARCHGTQLQGQVGPTLVGVFERHGDESLLGILRNGIYIGTGAVMPAWGPETWQYPEGRFDDTAHRAIVDYLRQSQPPQLPPGAEQYQTPGVPLPAPAAGGVPPVSESATPA